MKYKTTKTLDSIRIVFTSRHLLVDLVAGSLSRFAQVFMFDAESSKRIDTDGVQTLEMRYGTFGLGYVLRLLGSEITLPAYVKKMTPVLMRIKPTHIVTLDFFKLTFVQAIWFVKKNPETKLYVYCETQQWPSRWYAYVIMKLFFVYLQKNKKYIEAIFVYTNYGKDFFSKYVPTVPVILVPVPVDTNLFIPGVRQKSNTLRLICNARYAQYKRHDDLFKAVASLVKAGSNISLTCIGRADTGRMRVEKLVQQLQLESVVQFIDPVPQSTLVEIYQQHDVLVLPSHNEAIGMVVPEAMACGVATVTSDTVGANVYVVEGETGLIYPVGGVKALAKALQKMSKNDTSEQYGKRAREHMVDQHTLAAGQQRFIQSLGLSCHE